MRGSLRARLIVSFSLVVGLAVFLAGAGSLFLLRDQQQETARARYGHLAEPINVRVAAMQERGDTPADIKTYLRTAALQSNVRLLLLDQDQLVIFDSTTAPNSLFNKYVLSFDTFNARVVDANGTRFKWANYDANGAHLTLFTVPPRPANTAFAAPEYETIVAIPQSELSSAWLELLPRLALAGAIALTVSFIVSYFISRSISGPLVRITQASRQMASGDYDVHIPISGQDEVGRLSEAFNAMATEVSSSHRMMKDLLANVSHELKTPLTSIQGYSQAMLDGAVSSSDDFKESSRIIHEEANRMRALVDDLLLLSQIESGQLVMEHTHVDLVALLQRMIERFQWSLRDAGVESHLRVGAVPAVHGDERRLEQVFSNLIENAVRHTPPAGVITISAASLPDGSVRVGVHNTGSVIPAEDLPRVFERFFQVDRARARKGGSSGLGLSIVSEIVDAHGGSVRAESSETSGTEFVVTLPNPLRTDVRNGRVAPLDEGRSRRAPRRGQQPRSTNQTA
ncbi:MAG: HAMP domain-containing protein [Chloroflexi bacterium]|nr:HAMP domain-containing protein [Chloroflexota bacterium]